jgi:hypothetical protein
MRDHRIPSIGVLSLLLGLAGCSSTIHDYARVGGLDTLSIDAKQRLVLVRDDPSTGRRVVCAEPSPDAIVAASAALAAQGSGTQATGQNIRAAFGGGRSESAASIAMRTSTVQVLRDGYYRLCEGVMNGVIPPEKYKDIIAEIGPFIATIMAADAIGGSVQAPAVAISGGSITASAGGTANGANSGVAGLKIDRITATSQPGAIEADQIAKIIELYLAHRRNEYFRQAGRYDLVTRLPGS